MIILHIPGRTGDYVAPSFVCEEILPEGILCSSVADTYITDVPFEYDETVKE